MAGFFYTKHWVMMECKIARKWMCLSEAGTRFVRPEPFCDQATSTVKFDLEKEKDRRISRYWKGFNKRW